MKEYRKTNKNTATDLKTEKSESELSQSHNQTASNLYESDTTNLKMIWEKEPYLSLIEKKQYRKCALLHREKVNRFRAYFGGQLLSYSQCRKRLQRFLAMREQQVYNDQYNFYQNNQ